MGSNIEVLLALPPYKGEEVLGGACLKFLEELESRFGKKRRELLSVRKTRQQPLDKGTELDFLAETEDIREDDWQIAALPLRLQDRRVEITDPGADRKMMINALNSGANCYMADIEDSSTPTWSNVIKAQINLRDACHDDSRVAHPGLVPLVKEVFSGSGSRNNQLDVKIEEEIKASTLLQIPEGKITKAGFRHGVQISLRYLESWLRGIGCVPTFHLMEDAATAEISRTQIWQWIHHGVSFSDGGCVIDRALARKLIAEEGAKIEKEMAEQEQSNRVDDAITMFTEQSTSEDLDDFLTLQAYDRLVLEGV